MKIINVKKQSEYKETAIEYFQKQWATENSLKVYDDSISRSISTKNSLPMWYLLEDNEKIIGCVGLITNDFISCMDLVPWLCALFIDEKYRGNSLGNMLISQVKQDAKEAGFDKVYLCTDHVGYYEKYGFTYIGTGYHPWGDSSRVYECSTAL